jgi:hypothetical protein
MTAKELSLKDYVEGRFNRLVIEINAKLKGLQDESLSRDAANDVRYQQRFEAQGRELDKAFNAAKEAVNAALAGADKAAVKTEQTADKRFADLGDLIKEQFKGSTLRLDSTIERIENLENRLNTTSGASEGKTAMWGYVIGGIGALFSLASLVTILVHILKS